MRSHDLDINTSHAKISKLLISTGKGTTKSKGLALTKIILSKETNQVTA